MSDERWTAAKAALEAALAQEPAKRRSFLEHHCGHDPSLLAEVLSLLESYDERFLERPASPVPVTTVTRERQMPSAIGPYTVLRKLGVGGMGEVFEVRDVDGQKYALKRLAEARELASPESLSRMRREAQAVAALEHPNIVRFVTMFEDDGLPHIVMELLNGRSLAKILGTRRRLRQSDAVSFAIQIGDALACAHAIGIVHRDLKPANVLVIADGRLKLLDFGIAKLTESLARNLFEADAALTKTGEILGTAGYMAPEQARGKKIDTRADIFAFGCLLYRMVSGRETFEGESPLERRLAILRDEPVPLTERIPDTDPDLSALVHGCLRKDPDDRPESMALVLALLRGLSV